MDSLSAEPQERPKDTGVGSLSLLQGIFPTWGLNPGLPHCRWILYQLSHKGSPRTLEWVAYPFSSRSSQPRNWTGVSCIAGGFFTNWAMRDLDTSNFPSLCLGSLYWSPLRVRRASQVALVVKNRHVNAGDARDVGSVPGLGRSPGEGNGNPLQYSCLENPMDRGAWWAMACRVTKSWKHLKRLSTHARKNKAHKLL